MNHLHRRGLVAAAVLAAAGLTTGPTGLRCWSAAILTAYLVLTVVVLLAARRSPEIRRLNRSGAGIRR
jgi:hypothetical protein